MKYFGTVKSFDEAKGFGSIKAEAGGEELRRAQPDNPAWSSTKEYVKASSRSAS